MLEQIPVDALSNVTGGRKGFPRIAQASSLGGAKGHAALMTQMQQLMAKFQEMQKGSTDWMTKLIPMLVEWRKARAGK